MNDNYLSAKVVGKEGDSLWTELIESYTPENLFYRQEWDDFFFAVFKRYPIRILIGREDQPISIFKVFPVQSTSDRFGLSRGMVSGWPLGLGHVNQIYPITPIGAQETIKILSFLERISKKYGCSFLSLYFSSEQLDPDWFKNRKFIVQAREKISIDLVKSEEQLLKEMSRNCRRNIKKAEEQGMQLFEADDKIDLAKYFAIVEDTHRRLRLPQESLNLYESAWEHLAAKGLGRLFLVNLKDEIVGGVFLFECMKKAYGWSAATSDKRSLVAPGHFMHWNIIRTLKKEGLETYDIGERESLEDERGIIRFKRELGADFTRVYVARKVTKRIKYLLTDRLITPIFHSAINLKRALTKTE